MSPMLENAYITVWYPVMDGNMVSFGTHSSSSSSVRVLLLAWADSTRLPTTQSTVLHVYLPHSLQYYRQVHNPLIFHYWFPCMLRLPVTPLPKMNSELTSHDPRDCCLFWLVLCVSRYVLRVMCRVVRWCVMRGAWWSVFMRFFARWTVALEQPTW